MNTEQLENWLRKQQSLLAEMEASKFWGNAREYYLKMPRYHLQDAESMLRRFPRIAAFALQLAQGELSQASEAIERATEYGLPMQIV